jgi:predicted MFS family arabinose efflux permease
VILALVATSGFFYVNIMPALVESLTGGLGFDSRQAGMVSSANVYGAALGALVAVLLVRRLRWRPTAMVLLAVLILADLASMQLERPMPLVGLRLLHGTAGGMLVGLTYGLIARIAAPEKTFGILLAVQFGLGGLGVALLPRLVPAFGTQALFLTLVTLSAVSLVLMQRLPAFGVLATAPRVPAGGVAKRPLLLALLALLLFQGANMGLYAFIIDLGRHFGNGPDFISAVLLVSAWIGIAGALLAAGMSTRFGRTWPVLAAALVTALLTWLLLASAWPWAYALSNIGIGVTWALVVPYLFGMAAELDRSGQAAALAGLTSKLGLATGPLAAGFLLGDGSYAWLVHLSAAALVLSALAAMVPARWLDRRGEPQA